MPPLKRIIPCLDVDNGRVVKGTNFVDLRDAGDPVELAERYDEEGADEVVFLDITATSDDRDTIVELARRAADNVFIPFTIGGGIRSVEDAQAVLDAGADKVAINSAAVKRPGLIGEMAEVFGSQCVVLAIDAKRTDDTAGGRSRLGSLHGGRHAWRPASTPSPGRSRALKRGAGEILLTSMDRDGTKDGYDIELTRTVADAVSVPVIASGRRRNARGHGHRCLRGPRRRRARGIAVPLRRVHASHRPSTPCRTPASACGWSSPNTLRD